MLYKRIVVSALLIGVGIIGSSGIPKTFEINVATASADITSPIMWSVAPSSDAAPLLAASSTSKEASTASSAFNVLEVVPMNEQTRVKTVPFYSQFNDISAPEWKKVGCGITSLAMLINYYQPNEVTVDGLLKQGIAAGAYISDAGWSHAGLIGLAQKHGLTGESRSLADLSMENAFAALESEVADGPVMVSVHYMFEPTNPIPHLVVVNAVNDGLVYYNDPAEPSGNGAISISKFKSAWKKRYINIHPA